MSLPKTKTNAPDSKKITPTPYSKLNQNYQAKSYDEDMLGMDNPNKYLDSDAYRIKTLYDQALEEAKGGKSGGGGGYNPYYVGGARPFTPSAQYQQELIHANNILNALKDGDTPYTAQLNNIISRIQNRPAFRYDMDSDTMFQQSLSSAMGKGQLAMQDTMGQAAALTGGYGSTYATSAGNQAYNSFIQDAYNNLPDYYNMALQAYNLEGQRLADQASLLQSQDQSWYQRIVNAYQAQADKVNNMYNQEYQNYWQTQQMNQSAAQHNAEMAYKQASASGSGSGNSKTYKVSDFTNEIKQAVEKYGANSAEYDDYIAMLANNYGLDPVELDMVGQTYHNPKYTLNAQNQYVDQWGNYVPESKTYINSKGQNAVGLRLVEPAKSDSKGKRDDSMDIYEDDFGNRYTLAELRARGLA